MLNIGKLAPGGGEYYLSSVASSVEAYYTGAGEAPGRWVGAGSKRLGLAGLVSAETLRAVLAGVDPADGRPLAGPARSVPGFDLTFRAPKSVSLLWALADTDVAGEVRRAHDVAVTAATNYLEDHAAFARRGKAGCEQVGVDGFVAAAFRHRTSRADDPLLHTHVLVVNLAHSGDDGRWRTLDARHLYLHAKTAGYLYQVQLRAELTRRLDVTFGPVVNGCADLQGVPRPVIEAFSRRRADILATLATRGEGSARAAQVATLATRTGKTHTPPDQLRDAWRRRATGLGFGPRQVAAVTRQPQLHSDELEARRVQARQVGWLLGPAGRGGHHRGRTAHRPPAGRHPPRHDPPRRPGTGRCRPGRGGHRGRWDPPRRWPTDHGRHGRGPLHHPGAAGPRTPPRRRRARPARHRPGHRPGRHPRACPGSAAGSVR